MLYLLLLSTGAHQPNITFSQQSSHQRSCEKAAKPHIGEAGTNKCFAFLLEKLPQQLINQDC